jgi:hypothetical protein
MPSQPFLQSPIEEVWDVFRRLARRIIGTEGRWPVSEASRETFGKSWFADAPRCFGGRPTNDKDCNRNFIRSAPPGSVTRATRDYPFDVQCKDTNV